MRSPSSQEVRPVLRVNIPLHVSGLWFPVTKCSLINSGSLGAGVNLEIKLIAQPLYDGRQTLILNNKEHFIEHYGYILRNTGARPVGIYAETPMRPGAGFAVSSAASIATAVILQIVSGIRKTIEKMLWPAHEAEIMMSTGLGDVLAEYYGGAEIRVRPGAPGIGLVEHIPFDSSYRIVVADLGMSIGTPRMLAEITDKEYGYARSLYSSLLKEPSIEDLFTYSNMFTRKIFDYSMVDDILAPIKNIVQGYYLKKSALVVLVDKRDAETVAEHLFSKGLKPVITKISMEGVRIVYSREPSEKRESIDKRENS
ncbi:MAG: kinase [Crenarchaeota archaeon]|nr:kinase [Thermoproteota archaeon]